MPEKKPLAVDYSQENSTSPLVPNPPLLTSHGSGWKDIHLAHHRQPSWELPDVKGAQHVIVLPAPKQVTDVEFIEEKHVQKIQYHPRDYVNGFIELFPAYRPYRCSWNKEVEFIHYYLEPKFLAHVAYESVNPDRVELVLELRRADLFIYHLCLAIKAGLETYGANSGFLASELAAKLSIHLLQHYSTRKYDLPKYGEGLSRSKLNQALEYINEHLGDTASLRLDKISDELGMDQNRFSKMFKQSMGISPHQYVLKKQMEWAEQLLKNKELTITAIAELCGFYNQSHFAKHFRRFTGLTPKQFRRNFF
ncbi:MAG: AraC family transcriptional regulator [Elainella sp. Prado103]|jgi:AraC family transcriptional regulator|nr:AraC family transcriptional regulator [Elainella sp. Prado103]